MQKNIRRTSIVLSSIFAVWMIGSSGAAYAELGGTLASINREQATFSSSLISSQQSNYTTYTQTIGQNLVVKEYVASNGTVFAISWKGPTIPNLEIFLGTYYQNYLVAVQQNPRSVYVQSNSLVIESSGMMGGYSGRAYLPLELPSSFNPANI